MRNALSILLLLLPITFAGCSSKDGVTEAPKSARSVNVSEYTKVVRDNTQLITEWVIEKKGVQDGLLRSSQVEVEKFQEIQERLLSSALKFSAELGLSESDLETLLGVQFRSRADYEQATLGLMLFTVVTHEYLNTQQLRGGSFGECFLEATGIGMGISFVKDLSSNAIGREAVERAVKKLVTKVGVRTLSGIGLALLAAEITWCMW